MKGDYAQIAEGMGAKGIVVKSIQELIASIKDAMYENKNGNTVLIDVHTGYDDKRSKW